MRIAKRQFDLNHLPPTDTPLPVTMASLASPPFSLFAQQQDEFAHFEPSHFSSAPMDLSIAADAYVPFVQRAPSQELYTSPSTISYDSSLYAADNYILNGPTSPAIYGDDYLPSSNLSTASGPSAPSSAVGSPLSNHGHISIADWTVTGLGIQAGDLLEFSSFGAHGLDEMTAFELAGLTHAKSFVGTFFFSLHFSFPPLSLPFFLFSSSFFSSLAQVSQVAACPGAFPLWAALGFFPPAGLPLGPLWLLLRPPDRWCRIPAAQHCTTHCIASQAVPKAHYAAAL